MAHIIKKHPQQTWRFCVIVVMMYSISFTWVSPLQAEKYDTPTPHANLSWEEVLNPTPKLLFRANPVDTSEEIDQYELIYKTDESTAEEVEIFTPFPMISWQEMLAVTVVAYVTYPFSVPFFITIDTNLEPGYFSDYPYSHQLPGHMVFASTEESVNQQSDDSDSVAFDETTIYPCENPRKFAARIRGDWTSNFDDFDRGSAHILIDTRWRVGIEADYNFYNEDYFGTRRETHVGDVNLVFRFAQGETSQWRTGLGVNWMNGDTVNSNTEAGLNWTYGFDLFPVNPFVVSGEIDWGLIGQRDMFHARGTVGVLLNRFEAYVGYDYYFLKDYARNEGLISGVRLWF